MGVEKMKYNNYLRIPKKYNHTYIANLLQEFSNLFDEQDIAYLNFGKQDLRGDFAITKVYKNGCCDGVAYFTNSLELISYIRGFLAHKNKLISDVIY
ncbi:MAG: hypothetical protein PWQ43_739 [Rikenellaceae bacterium]|nr:hypothetical protein [Rikenellaceae bacterium]